MAREHGVGRGTPDSAVPWRVFAVVGSGVGVIAAIYWFTSYEEAGTAMLALAAALALWCAVYLWRQGRATPAPPHQIGETEAQYLPHDSVWPFAIGCGAFFLLNGLLVGGWFFLPGVAVLVVGLGGFVRQSRERS